MCDLITNQCLQGNAALDYCTSNMPHECRCSEDAVEVCKVRNVWPSYTVDRKGEACQSKDGLKSWTLEVRIDVGLISNRCDRDIIYQEKEPCVRSRVDPLGHGL